MTLRIILTLGSMSLLYCCELEKVVCDANLGDNTRKYFLRVNKEAQTYGKLKYQVYGYEIIK